MARLTIRTPGGKVHTVHLHKRLTSIGRGPDNDVQLEDPAVPDSALHVLFDGTRYEVGSLGAIFQINGRKRDKHVLATDDIIRVGGTELAFAREDAPAPQAPGPDAATLDPDAPTSEVPALGGQELEL